MSSAQRPQRATKTARRARETAESVDEIFSGARSASSTSRTTGTRGDVLDRPRRRKSTTRRVTTTGPVVPVSPAASSGSPSWSRRHPTSLRTSQRMDDDQTPPNSPRTTGDEVTTPLTPQSDVSREGGETSDQRSDIMDDEVTEEFEGTATDAEGPPEQGLNEGETFGMEEEDTENPSPPLPGVSVDTTSEGDEDVITTGDKRLRPVRRQKSR